MLPSLAFESIPFLNIKLPSDGFKINHSLFHALISAIKSHWSTLFQDAGHRFVYGQSGARILHLIKGQVGRNDQQPVIIQCLDIRVLSYPNNSEI